MAAAAAAARHTTFFFSPRTQTSNKSSSTAAAAAAPAAAARKGCDHNKDVTLLLGLAQPSQVRSYLIWKLRQQAAAPAPCPWITQSFLRDCVVVWTQTETSGSGNRPRVNTYGTGPVAAAGRSTLRDLDF